MTSLVSLYLCLWIAFLAATTCRSQTNSTDRDATTTQEVTPTAPDLTTLQDSTLETTGVLSTTPSISTAQTLTESSSTQSSTEPSSTQSSTEPWSTTADSQTETLTTAIYILIAGGAAMLLLLIIGVACIIARFTEKVSDHRDEMEMEMTGDSAQKKHDDLTTLSHAYAKDVDEEDLPYPIDPNGAETLDQMQDSPVYANFGVNEGERVQSVHSVSSEEDADTPANATHNSGNADETNKFREPPHYANLDGNQRERVESTLSVSDQEDSDF